MHKNYITTVTGGFTKTNLMDVLFNITTNLPITFLDGPYFVDGKPAELESGIVELTVIGGTVPEHDPATHTTEISWAADLVNMTYGPVYTLREKTIQEKTEYFSSLAEAANIQLNVPMLKEIILSQLKDLDPEEKERYNEMFPSWAPGITLSIGDIIQWDGTLWEVIQGHTTQLDWIPNQVPALFKKHFSPEVIPNWIQPQGSHDAYKKGDRVTHIGIVWESLIDANVWEPGIYGWNSVTT